jgi:hypothetical protein
MTALDRFRIGRYRLHRTVTQVVSGLLQSIENFPSVGVYKSCLAKSWKIFRSRIFLTASSDFEMLLLSVMFSSSVVTSSLNDALCSVVFVCSESLIKISKCLRSFTEGTSDLSHSTGFESCRAYKKKKREQIYMIWCSCTWTPLNMTSYTWKICLLILLTRPNTHLDQCKWSRPIGYWRKLYNVMVYNLHTSSDVNSVIKFRTIMWARYWAQ